MAVRVASVRTCAIGRKVLDGEGIDFKTVVCLEKQDQRLLKLSVDR